MISGFGRSIVGLAILAFTLSGCSGSSEVAENTPPGEIVENFYAWYIDYARNTGNPLVDEAYVDSEYLNAEVVTKVQGIVASFDQGGYDPILCAQDIPESIEVVQIEEQGALASYRVITSLGNSFQVDLERTEAGWQIGDIVCSE